MWMITRIVQIPLPTWKQIVLKKIAAPKLPSKAWLQRDAFMLKNQMDAVHLEKAKIRPKHASVTQTIAIPLYP